MNKLFPDFEYLSVLRGNGTAIEGPTTERTGMGDIDWSTSLVGEGNVVVESAIFQFLENGYF